MDGSLSWDSFRVTGEGHRTNPGLGLLKPRYYHTKGGMDFLGRAPGFGGRFG